MIGGANSQRNAGLNVGYFPQTRSRVWVKSLDGGRMFGLLCRGTEYSGAAMHMGMGGQVLTPTFVQWWPLPSPLPSSPSSLVGLLHCPAANLQCSLLGISPRHLGR